MSHVYLVLDDLALWPHTKLMDAVISFDTYLHEHPIKGQKKTRVINLCNTDRYLSKGYYCSLLAEARGHKVLPAVNTLTDLGNKQLYLLRVGEILTRLGKDELGAMEGDELCFKIFFGRSDIAELKLLGRRLFERFPCPILEVTLCWQQSWQIQSINPAAFAGLDQRELPDFMFALEKFTQSLWRNPRSSKASRWEMAILVNPDEKLPPSDAKALKKMERAANKVGFHVEFIGPRDYARLGEFDALFIRETTAIDHHTYHFSRKAEIEGLVVMDDPTSILRCCNKVFLHDAFSYSGVPTLRTEIVSSDDEESIAALESIFSYPLVLKIPNGAFSVGVMKAENREQLQSMLGELLSKSALILAQEYLYTEYDWRIGILNNRPLFACRYFMAKGHWQIYDHGDGRISPGGWETLPTYEVPKAVLDAALKSARIIGDGLYGIDIKQQGSKVYVIEVNDNPSLEHEVEDAFIGDELYMQIMSEFARRLENRGRD
ncbi:MAG: RimK family protein [Pseudomonadales bacterium]|nr:RimK family protein [Pseudomonadales bacterium]